MNFDKILIANRGEIACRVISTAKNMGYRTVAVFSEADRSARHVELADEAVCIGPASVSQSYLNVDALLKAAATTGANAIHPGYGFLSENADFARACEAASITFIGPPVDAIHLMGSKRLSKIAMQKANVPCIPGYEGDDQTDETLLQEAKHIGLPLMIKASAGGGGRGMRVVTNADDLSEQLRSARAESKSAFGSDELILERAVVRPRHVEIQVFGDHQGNVIYLGERDCSVQRRHQKVVEEAPSPAVNGELRAKMGEAAVNAAKACNYVGAGTVEFLLEASGEFYFLEMNTRLQVEHPVTELITGQDLVAWQIRVARGEPLPLTQDQVVLTGHAIEVRLYAEDPAEGFLPQTGPVLRWQPAEGEGVRIDHGLREGGRVSSHYDPMLAKIIAWGDTREDARRRLIRAIEDCTLLGVRDNRVFLANILRHPVFADGKATTAFIEEDFADDVSMHPGEPDAGTWALAATLFSTRESHGGHRNWRNSPTAGQPLLLTQENQTRKLAIMATDNHLQVSDDSNTTIVILSGQQTDQIAEVDGVRKAYSAVMDGNRLYLQWNGQGFIIENVTHVPSERTGNAASGQLKAPMDGAIMEVRATAGQSVNKGESLILMEAMKIEHSLKAAINGTIEAVNVTAGDQVKGKQLLVTIAPNEE